MADFIDALCAPAHTISDLKAIRWKWVNINPGAVWEKSSYPSVQIVENKSRYLSILCRNKMIRRGLRAGGQFPVVTLRAFFGGR